jgi:hypothetical protein
VKAPSFTQIRPTEENLARVERNTATTLGQYAQLLNGGLTLKDNAAGRVLPEREVVVPLSAPLEFTLGKGAAEPVAVALLCAEDSDGMRLSGGCLSWSWSTEQTIGKVTIQSLPSDVPPGTYTAVFFVVGG